MAHPSSAALVCNFCILVICAITAFATPITMSQKHNKTKIWQAAAQKAIANSRAEVIKLLSTSDWYPNIVEKLKEQLKKRKETEMYGIPLAQHELNLEKRANHLRYKRDVGKNEDTNNLSDLEKRLQGLIRSRRNVVPFNSEHSTMQVIAKVNIDGLDVMNIVKTSEKGSMEKSTEIIKADLGDTEIELKLKMTVRKPQLNNMTVPDKKISAHAEDLISPSSSTTVTSTSTSTVKPTSLTTSLPIDSPAEKTQAIFNSHKNYVPGNYQLDCPTNFQTNWCFFNGSCIYYALLDHKLCKCRPGHKGQRCEMFDMLESLDVLQKEEKRGVISKSIGKFNLSNELDSVINALSLYFVPVPAYDDLDKLNLADLRKMLVY